MKKYILFGVCAFMSLKSFSQDSLKVLSIDSVMYYMRPLINAVLVILSICSCNNSDQNRVVVADTTKQTISITKPPDTTKNITSMRKTEFKLDTLQKNSLGKMILISNGQFSPYKAIKINSRNFDLVTKEKDTIYLGTIDKEFRTPEGYKVGTKLFDLPKDIQSGLTKEPGWGYYYKLSSGWALGFCEGSTCTDHYPKANSRVKWIFKRQ